jgi:hypothetical protein
LIKGEIVMTQDESQAHSAPSSASPRGADRRFCTQLAPPPYSTTDGTVQNDRRAYLDRRASWVKDFFMDIGEREQR